MSQVISDSNQAGHDVPSPEHALEMLQHLFDSASAETLDDRRMEERAYVFNRLVLQKVDEDLTPVGASIQAMSRDVSSSGLGWISTIPLVGPLIKVTMFHEDEERSVIIKMAHQRKIGPVFVAGGSVVVNFSELSEQLPE